jgi:uncharacterized protein (DUF1330 family)
MTHYIVARIAIHDRERYGQYEAGFMEVFARHGGQILAVNDAPEVLEGPPDDRRLVILAFPDKAAALAWAGSPEYREIAKHRYAASEGAIVITEGFAPPP